MTPTVVDLRATAGMPFWATMRGVPDGDVKAHVLCGDCGSIVATFLTERDADAVTVELTADDTALLDPGQHPWGAMVDDEPVALGWLIVAPPTPGWHEPSPAVEHEPEREHDHERDRGRG